MSASGTGRQTVQDIVEASRSLVLATADSRPLRGYYVIQSRPEVDPQRPLQVRLVLGEQDPGEAGALRTGQRRRIARPWQGSLPRLEKIDHGPIIAHAAVTAR